MSENQFNEILKDMERQGFPLEVKISNVLKAHDWEVTNQVAYSDMETEKQRTVDIVAEKNILLKPSELGLDVWLVIECKKSNKPWVFYTTDFDLNKDEIRRKTVSSSSFSMNTIACQKGFHDKLIELISNQFLLKNKFVPSVFKKLAYIPFEPFTNGEGMSVHKARMQVCNAILDIDENFAENWGGTIDFPYGIIFVPIIVLDGQLCTYEDSKLEKTDGLYYYVTCYGSSFMIDVVISDFFENYLDNIEKTISRFREEK